jgi:hypothetical protein
MQERLYGHPGSGYFNMDTTGKYQELHDTYAVECDRAIREYCNANSIPDYHAIICATWGGTQIQGTNKLPQLVVESGIGYHHTFAKYRAFESYAWLHFHWGRENRHQGANWYDVVIPNAFDTAMFPYSPAEKRKDYFLYIGRMNDDKGLPIAIDVTKRLGAKLLLVGPTDAQGPGRFLNGNPNVEYRPPVGVEERMKLMGEAKAAFVPSIYLEPFAGVNVELQMTGCPVITTDWGAFTETVLHGITGYRCRTLEQFIWAAKNIDRIRNEHCRDWAVSNYSLERIAPMYEEFFQMVLNLRGTGWPQEHPGRTHLNWLTKTLPALVRQVDTDKPVKVVDKEPNSPEAINVPFADLILTPRFAKDVAELRTYDMNIRQILEEPLEFPPHVAPKIKTHWEETIAWESNWWGLEPAPRWDEEVKKQKTYAQLMGLPADLNMGNASILDIGCGPVSMLLRANRPESIECIRAGVDPLAVSDATKKKYEDHGIKFYNVKAEDLRRSAYALKLLPSVSALHDANFDEVWIYNCLQHVDNPSQILFNAKLAAFYIGSVVRIFEWIDLGVCPGHPHNLTEQLFLDAFPENMWTRRIWNTGTLRGFGGTVTNKYLALCVERIT